MGGYKWMSKTMIDAERVREDGDRLAKDEPLKPCPFCGSKARLAEFGSRRGVGCDTIECFCSIGSNPTFKSTADAVIAWNGRKGEDNGLSSVKTVMEAVI